MSEEKLTFNNAPLGLDIGVMELVIDRKSVDERLNLVQWENQDYLSNLNVAPPGIEIVYHARMKLAKFKNERAGIWYSSEHEFLKPIKIGSKICIRGKLIDKYIKRGKKFSVVEFESVDEDGDVVLRSVETGVVIE